MKKHPYIITDREYWLSPAYVFTGLTWLILGIDIGLLF